MIKAQFSKSEAGAEIVRVNLWSTVPVTVVKPRKAPKVIMGAKKTKTFQAGTSGAKTTMKTLSTRNAPSSSASAKATTRSSRHIHMLTYADVC